MKRTKKVDVKRFLPFAAVAIFSLLWFFLLLFPEYRPWKFLLAVVSSTALLTAVLKFKALREVLADGRFWVLALASSLTVILAKVAQVFNWFHLERCGDIYYLLFAGSLHGPLFKSFLRKDGKTFYTLLGINTLSVALATLNPFVTTAYAVSNLISSDIYARRRDSLSEIEAVVVGNGVYSTVLVGDFLIKAPEKVFLVPIFYPISVVTDIFILFGLQKLLDLLPFMFSDEKLEGMANLSNPLVEEMLLKAPGTYHHSVMVSLLSESLARKVGADPLITKVGAMFHDIGKLVNPQYFVENINGKNPHDELKPEVSAAIIKSHVTEGLTLAKKYHLPEEIIRFIPEHQGTKLIKYFYYKALKMNNGEVDEEKFRYAGPVPLSKETAIVMIADTVEAMVRALKQPTPDDIKKVVANALKQLVEEGQLSKSGLTADDLRKIEKYLIELMLSYYHERIKYPDEIK